MRDADLARRAQERGFVSAEQLREAQQFAAGGRSLLSVLLDLGHLKPDDLLRLGEAPPPARSNGIFWLVTLAALAVAVFAALRSSSHERFREMVERQEAAALEEPSSFSDQASTRARSILAEVERRLDARGRPPAASERDLRRAAALLEESSRLEDRLALARIRELLDDWEGARELYQRSLSEDPESLPALLGAARTCLLLREPAAARVHADQACRRPHAPAEALYLRGAAALTLGDGDAAAKDLSEAARLDSSFKPRIASLVSGRLR